MENKKYDLTISNGVATGDIVSGSYNVTANITGYNNTTIDPSSLTINTTTNSYELTIKAEGTLTLRVTDTGLETGNPIVGATFYRTDKDGTKIGEAITTNEQGLAVLEHVPYAEAGAPNVYFIQTASDGNHDYDGTMKTTTLSSQTVTMDIQNPAPTTKTFTIKEYYTNVPIESGQISLEN